MRTLGVIGGLGAESTIEYYRLLVSAGGFGRRRDTHCPPRYGGIVSAEVVARKPVQKHHGTGVHGDLPPGATGYSVGHSKVTHSYVRLPEASPTLMRRMPTSNGIEHEVSA